MVLTVLSNIELVIVNPPDGSSAQSVNTYFSWLDVPETPASFAGRSNLQANDPVQMWKLYQIETNASAFGTKHYLFFGRCLELTITENSLKPCGLLDDDCVQSDPNVNPLTVHVPAGEFRMGCDMVHWGGMIAG